MTSNGSICLSCSHGISTIAWWRHQMEIFSVLLAICAENSPVTSEFPAQRPVTRSFDIFPDLRLNKRLSTNRDAGDLRRHRACYDFNVMSWWERSHSRCRGYIEGTGRVSSKVNLIRNGCLFSNTSFILIFIIYISQPWHIAPVPLSDQRCVTRSRKDCRQQNQPTLIQNGRDKMAAFY